MRGPVNTKIKLKIMRKARTRQSRSAIIRDVIRVRSVRRGWKAIDVGFIRVHAIQ